MDYEDGHVEKHARDLVRMFFGWLATSQQFYQVLSCAIIQRFLLRVHILSKTSEGSGYILPCFNGLILLA